MFFVQAARERVEVFEDDFGREEAVSDLVHKYGPQERVGAFCFRERPDRKGRARWHHQVLAQVVLEEIELVGVNDGGVEILEFLIETVFGEQAVEELENF